MYIHIRSICLGAANYSKGTALAGERTLTECHHHLVLWGIVQGIAQFIVIAILFFVDS